MSDRPEAIQKATIGIAVLVLASKVIGFFREAVIAHRFGTGQEYDLYLIAVSVPIALYTLFAYSFSTIFIPRYIQAAAAADKEKALSQVWSEFNLSVMGAAATTVALLVFAGRIIPLLAPGINPALLTEAIFITRVSSVIIIIAILECFFRSVLNAKKIFILPAGGPIAANIIIVSSILIFSDQFSTRAILYGVIIGYAVQMLVVYLPFRSTGIGRYINSRIITPHSKKFFLTALIILIIEASSQVYAIVDRYFASYMEPGMISALGYSYLLIMLPISIFAFSLSTAVFPYFSDTFVSKDATRRGYLISRAVTVSFLFSIPIMIIYWIFGEELVILLFQRGAFDQQSVEVTTRLLKYFSLGIAGQFLIWILSRLYYAAGKYGVLVFQVVLIITAKVILAIYAVEYLGDIGIAVSSSVSYSLGAILLLLFSGQYLSRVDKKTILVYFSKLLLAGAMMFIVSFALYNWLVAEQRGHNEIIFVMGPTILIGVIVFAASAYAMRISEIYQLIENLRRRK